MYSPAPVWPAQGSPVSDDGRGLKQRRAVQRLHALAGSPVSDDGRGLKQGGPDVKRKDLTGSPVSDDGRGLKQQKVTRLHGLQWVRPSVMTGVD